MWYLRQIFPTPFSTVYGRHKPDGSIDAVHCRWWMWLGRCFRVREFVSGPWAPAA